MKESDNASNAAEAEPSSQAKSQSRFGSDRDGFLVRIHGFISPAAAAVAHLYPLAAFTHTMSIDDNFVRVAPESYNRLKHPSLKQIHNFVTWLRESTVSELEATRGDIAATKDVFIRFFQRGLRADLLLSELMEIPSIRRFQG